MKVHCLAITNEIKEMAKKFKGETPQTLAIAIGTWQVQNKKGMEDYPSIKELEAFLNPKKANPDLNNF